MAKALAVAVKEKNLRFGADLMQILRQGPPLSEEMTEELANAILAWEDFAKRAKVPLVPDPDEEIEAIRLALNSGDLRRARRGMKELQDSMAAGGPQPSTEGKRSLCRLLLRQDWT